jgi:hypothetical protein
LFASVASGLTFCPHPVGADTTSANLTPASGRQDHTTSPYASAPFVSSPFDSSRTSTRETRPASRCAPDTAASTAPHPASVTIAIRPSCGVGWREFVEVICPTGEAKYFCNEDWTTQIRLRSHDNSPARRNGNRHAGRSSPVNSAWRRQRVRAAAAPAASRPLRQLAAAFGLNRSREDDRNLTSVEPCGLGTRMRVASSTSIVPCIGP